MAGERVFAVMIEPPLSVANGLMEATRRFCGGVSGREGTVNLLPPERYGVPLIIAPVDAERSPDVVAMALRAAAGRISEFAVQLAPLAPVDGTKGLVASAVQVQEADLAGVVAALREAFEAVGLEDAVTPAAFLPVATVDGVEALAACAAAAAEARDVPLAGWLVSGLVAAEGTPGPVPGTWQLVRTRAQMLKRLGAR